MYSIDIVFTVPLSPFKGRLINYLDDDGNDDDVSGHRARAPARRHSNAGEESHLQHQVVRLAHTNAFLL